MSNATFHLILSAYLCVVRVSFPWSSYFPLVGLDKERPALSSWGFWLYPIKVGGEGMRKEEAAKIVMWELHEKNN